MAESDYDEYGGGASPIRSAQLRFVTQTIGAVCSVAMIVGLGVWGYKLAVRDVNGVPVFRASSEPLRIAPSNPGGSVADHQGLAVNVVAAAGGQGDRPAEIVLAPPPVDLAAEDVPGLSPLPELEPTSAPEAPVRPQDGTAAAAMTEPSAGHALATDPPLGTEGEGIDLDGSDAVAQALSEALGDVQPLAPLAPEGTPLADLGLDGAAEADLGDGAEAPIRPQPRPSQPAFDAPAPEAMATPASREINTATLAAGTRLVQLGAFDSDELARGEWTRLVARFGDLMSGKALVVQTAQSGGRTFYRLRAHGFEGQDDARRFCAALLAEGAACIPVVHR